jgi:S-layer family protein
MLRDRRIPTFTLAFILGLAATASAQLSPVRMRKMATVQPATIDEPSTWGLMNSTIVTHTFLDFTEFDGDFAPVDPNVGRASCNSGFCYWVATLRVPNGVSLRGINISGCDGDGSVELIVGLAAGPRVPGNAVDITPLFSTGGAATPGCNSFDYLLPSPVTVNNTDFFYAIQVGADAGTNMSWEQVRVRYRLQVSAAPGTATFTDVPLGHPQRQFIEALVAAGITGGCGGGNYCPDNPVTRGQMAVFLAAALGLHWPF